MGPKLIIPDHHRRLGQQTVQVSRKFSWGKPLSAWGGPGARPGMVGQTPEHRPAPRDPYAGRSDMGGDGSRQIPEGTPAAQTKISAYRATGCRKASGPQLTRHEYRNGGSGTQASGNVHLAIKNTT